MARESPDRIQDLQKLKDIYPLVQDSDENRHKLLTTILQELGLTVNKTVEAEDKTVYPIWFSSIDGNDTLYIKDQLLKCATRESADNLPTIKDFTGIFVIPPQNEEFEVYSDEKIPIRFCDSLKIFPEFSIRKYQTYLQQCSKTPPQFGSILMYSQRIGSTHTTFEK